MEHNRELMDLQIKRQKSEDDRYELLVTSTEEKDMRETEYRKEKDNKEEIRHNATEKRMNENQVNMQATLTGFASIFERMIQKL